MNIRIKAVIGVVVGTILVLLGLGAFSSQVSHVFWKFVLILLGVVQVLMNHFDDGWMFIRKR